MTGNFDSPSQLVQSTVLHLRPRKIISTCQADGVARLVYSLTHRPLYLLRNSRRYTLNMLDMPAEPVRVDGEQHIAPLSAITPQFLQRPTQCFLRTGAGPVGRPTLSVRWPYRITRTATIRSALGELIDIRTRYLPVTASAQLVRYSNTSTGSSTVIYSTPSPSEEE